MREMLRDPAVAVAAVLLGIVLGLGGLWLAGWSPLAVVQVWYSTSCDPRHWPLSLKEAGPLLFAGLATAIAFRAGALNIGIEGQFLVGGIAYVGCATKLWQHPAALALPFALM